MKAEKSRFPPLPKARENSQKIGKGNTKEEEKEDEISEESYRKSITFLNGDAIRWMNKRKPSARNSQTNFVTPSRAIQLRAIFRGLDFDDSGEISLEELKDAVKYVSENCNSSTPVFEDPVKMGEFFESMDTDGNGTVDFNEFLVAMTTQSKAGDGNDDTANLQQIFYDFANQHRRQTIIDRIKDKSLSDTARYEEMNKLFSIHFFRDKQLDDTVEDAIEKIKEDALKEKREMNTESHRKQRQQELIRCRKASLQISAKKAYLQNPVFSSQISKHYEDPNDVMIHMSRNIEKQLINFSNINKETFISKALSENAHSNVDLKKKAISSSQEFKKSPLAVGLEPPMTRKQYYDHEMTRISNIRTPSRK